MNNNVHGGKRERGRGWGRFHNLRTLKEKKSKGRLEDSR